MLFFLKKNCKIRIFKLSELFIFDRALMEAAKAALSGQSIFNGVNEKALTTNFDLLNLVPADQIVPLHSAYNQDPTDRNHFRSTFGYDKRLSNYGNEDIPTKWRRVGLVSGANVQLDTIVWPGGDIVVSGKISWLILICIIKRLPFAKLVFDECKIKIFTNSKLFIGLSARARSVFRIVTALAPPFVMQSELDEDGLCLRGLPCHRLSPIGR